MILYLNDEYRSVLRSHSTSIDDAFDGRFIALNPQTYASLLETAARLGATSVFVEILKTAIKHAEHARARGDHREVSRRRS